MNTHEDVASLLRISKGCKREVLQYLLDNLLATPQMRSPARHRRQLANLLRRIAVCDAEIEHPGGNR
jgi:hypothetical protein